MFEQYLEKYAEVAIKVGLNLQPGQKLVVGGTGHALLKALEPIRVGTHERQQWYHQAVQTGTELPATFAP